MYELTLDNTSITHWFILYAASLLLLFLALGGAALLTSPTIRQRLAPLWLALAIVLIAGAGMGAVSALHQLTWSPTSYYRQRIAPSIAAGETLLRRYEAYRQAHGHYPANPGVVAFPELDHFHTIAGLRDDPTRCDGAGAGCRALRVEITAQNQLTIHIYDGLIHCPISNLRGSWRCRDQR